MQKKTFHWIGKNTVIAFALALLSAIAFGVLAELISDARIDHFDHRLIGYIQGLESKSLNRLMIFFTDIGTGVPLVVITAAIMFILYAVLGHRRELFLLSTVVLGSVLLNVLLKLVFQRARPTIHRIVFANGYSFPSGHSMVAFSLYGIVAYLLWKHVRTAAGRVLVVLASAFFILMIGLSRIYLGVHYPSDVVGGYLASICWLSSAIWFYQSFLERRKGERAGGAKG